MTIVNFCDCEKENGEVCNRTPEYLVKDSDSEIYLCDQCFYMHEPSKDSKSFYIS